jgi:hypothetical protein
VTERSNAVVAFAFSRRPLFNCAAEMAIRTSQAIILGLGVALSLTGIVTGIFGFNAYLDHANVASRNLA